MGIARDHRKQEDQSCLSAQVSMFSHISDLQSPEHPAKRRFALDPMRIHLGRHVYGIAAVTFSVITLVWGDFNGWQQIRVLGNIPHRAILVYIAAAVELFGGVAIQWPKTARAGALALGAIYLTFALLWVPRIAAEPLVYDRWGNFFEQLSLVSGALIVQELSAHDAPAQKKRTIRVGYILFGICVVSFTLEQLFYLSGTAEFVPKWMPPGQMFWAIATTIAFVLAAIALLSGHSALLAARMLTAMIIGFGLLVWLPALFTAPHQIFSWAGNAQNLAIAGAAWIVADSLSKTSPTQVSGS
jgi:uncharacterized membrane protein YphA (DoxX/SURF4 family)